MTAASDPEPGNIGVPGVKLLTATYPYNSSQPLWAGQQAIGGAEFDHAVSNSKNPEEEAARILKVFFHHTKVGVDYGDTPNENWEETMNYLDVPIKDVEYMNGRLCNATTLGQTSLLQQIDQANLDLLFMAGTLATREVSKICTAIGPPNKCDSPRTCCIAGGGYWNGQHCE